MKTLITLVLCFTALTSRVPAQAVAPTPYHGPVVVIVSFAIPQGLDRAKIERLFAQMAPAFQALPDLKQKYFTVNDATQRAGGVYLWNSRAAAEAFFSDAWKSGVQKNFGSAADLVWFDAPLIIRGKAGMQESQSISQEHAH